MLYGSWRWNACSGICALVVTLVASLLNNEWLTSLYRGITSFGIVYAGMYAIRFMLGTVAGLNNFTKFDSHTMIEVPERSKHSGTFVDLTTPDDDPFVADRLSKPGGVDEFVPLKPPELVSKEKLDPEKLAQSLRHMSEQ